MQTTDLTNDNIVFYDGACSLCSRTVAFLIKADSNRQLKFAPLNGVTSALLEIPTADEGAATVVFYKKGEIYFRSTAVLKIIKLLPFPWQLLRVFTLVPIFIRDYVYRIIGRNRYRWFGQNTTCILYHPRYEGQLLH